MTKLLHTISVIAVLLGCCLQAFAERTNNQKTNVIKVEETELARQATAWHILMQVPLIDYQFGTLLVHGVGEATVMLNGRELKDPLIELTKIRGNQVQEIEIITNPGEQYGSNIQAVIRFRLKITNENDFHIDNQLSAMMTYKMGWIENFTFSGKHEKLSYGGNFSYEKMSFNNRKMDFKQSYLTDPDGSRRVAGRDIGYSHPKKENESFFAGAGIGYQLNANHRIDLSYEYIRKPKGESTTHSSFTEHYGLDSDGYFDSHTILSSDTTFYSFKSATQAKHDVAINYRGKIGSWRLAGNAWMFWQGDTSLSRRMSKEQFTSISKFSRNEYCRDIKIVATHGIGNGKFGIGGESKYVEQENEKDDEMRQNDRIHALLKERNISAFANMDQTFGAVTSHLGFRLENVVFRYNPYHDDEIIYAVMQQENKSELESRSWAILPSTSIKTTIGNVKLSASYDLNCRQPFYRELNITSVEDNMTDPLSTLLKREYDHIVQLKGAYNILNASIKQVHYTRPLFSGAKKYNGPSFNAIDYQVILSPKFGNWQSSLSTTLHQQWLEMNTTKGDFINKPQCYISWRNSLSLPYNFLLTLSADYISKGTNRNINTYSSTYNVDAKLQSNFFHEHLELSISIFNLLKSKCTDVTKYDNSTDGKNTGSKEWAPRTGVFSARYKL
ncbi:MAG: outer membrane beta-barrel protein [Bacteroidales bacterium]|nr:outer membrane beta-barrel protein [Candidatus Physcocola equi]